MIYSEQVYTRYDDFDAAGKMLPTAVLTVLENVAGHHTDAVGATVGEGIAWILTEWQVEICRRPEKGEPITAETWSMGCSLSITTDRGFLLKDARGNILVKALATFVLLDLNTGKMLRLTEDMLARYAPEPHSPFEAKQPRLRLPAEFDREEALFIRKTDVDFNRHVHNTRYLDYALELLPEDADLGERVKAFRIAYRNALRWGDAAYIKAAENEKEMKIGIFVEDKLHTAISLTLA